MDRWLFICSPSHKYPQTGYKSAEDWTFAFQRAAYVWVTHSVRTRICWTHRNCEELTKINVQHERLTKTYSFLEMLFLRGSLYKQLQVIPCFMRNMLNAGDTGSGSATGWGSGSGCEWYWSEIGAGHMAMLPPFFSSYKICLLPVVKLLMQWNRMLFICNCTMTERS